MGIQVGFCATINGCSSLAGRHLSIESILEDVYDVGLPETLK